ncbi:MAG: hypothetical protein HY819_17580 [Acidobacteria bacterium]|nr:hypothetical protein [Acidobacteriota bacterium]
MTAKLNNSEKILAEIFQTARNLLKLSIAEYSHLFEISEQFILELERGEIPDTLDDKVFKILLSVLSLQINENLFEIFLTVTQKKYPNLKLDNTSALLKKLFTQNLSDDLSKYPWVSQTVKFRCRLMQLTDQANGILLWAEDPNIHQALVSSLLSSHIGHLSLVDNHTVIFIPKIYLFLKLNTTKSQLPLLLYQRFNEKLPIGLSIPKEPFLVKSPTQIEVNDANKRLFIFSPDSNSISEIVF